ncbi:Fis family transcriptional regulator, partial [Escherichia coli]|nr:Fis family transcriptional regulator [Escherichia coli]
VVSIALPALRQRAEDIPLLMAHFLQQAAVRYERPAPDWSAQDMMRWQHHDWPGNVRELRNAADRLVLGVGRTPVVPDASEDGMPLKERVERYERTVIAETLARTGGSVHQAADILQVGRATLYDKIK